MNVLQLEAFGALVLRAKTSLYRMAFSARSRSGGELHCSGPPTLSVAAMIIPMAMPVKQGLAVVTLLPR